jgi:hypothetical protein
MFKPSGTPRDTSLSLESEGLETAIQESVYIREVKSDEIADLIKLSEDQVSQEFFEQKLYAVYDEKGQRLAITNDRLSAFSFAKMNNLMPSSAH